MGSDRTDRRLRPSDAVEMAAAGAFALIGDPLGGIGSLLSTKAGELWRRRARETLGTLSLELEPDLLMTRLEEDDEFADVLLRILEMACRSRSSAKRRALGRVAAEAATRRVTYDELDLLLQTLSEVEEGHIRALVELSQLRSEDKDQLRHAVGQYSKRFPTPVRTGLLRLGLVSGQSIIGFNTAMINEVTDYERRLLEFLESPTDEPE